MNLTPTNGKAPGEPRATAQGQYTAEPSSLQPVGNADFHSANGPPANDETTDDSHAERHTLFGKGPAGGYVKMMRSWNAAELRRNDPNAFLLLSLIAERTRWNSSLIDTRGLQVGQSFVGDYKSAGIPTERQYRTALKHLIEYGLVETKATNRGTIVTLLDTSIYDPYPNKIDKQNDEQATNRRRTGDEQATNRRRLTKHKNSWKHVTVSNTDLDDLPCDGSHRSCGRSREKKESDSTSAPDTTGGQSTITVNGQLVTIPKGVRL